MIEALIPNEDLIDGCCYAFFGRRSNTFGIWVAEDQCFEVLYEDRQGRPGFYGDFGAGPAAYELIEPIPGGTSTPAEFRLGYMIALKQEYWISGYNSDYEVRGQSGWYLRRGWGKKEYVFLPAGTTGTDARRAAAEANAEVRARRQAR